MKKSLLIVCFLGFISIVVLCAKGFAEGLDSAVAQSLKREFPKLEFQSIRQTGEGGLYEVVAGVNVLYYDPKSGVILFGELFSRDWKNQTASERSKLLAVAFKDGQFDKAGTRSPIEGLYEVVSGQTVIYFDPKSGARLIGDMYSKEGQNLTSEVRDKAVARAALKELPLDRAIKIGKGKNIVVMFTDPDCSYCRKVEDYFRARKDVTRYVYLFPLEQIHPKSLDKAKIILCSKDRARAFLDAMGGSLDEGELKPCSDEKVAASLNENKSLAQKLDIQGTPYLIVNGVAVRGADTKRIDELLAEGGKK